MVDHLRRAKKTDSIKETVEKLLEEPKQKLYILTAEQVVGISELFKKLPLSYQHVVDLITDLNRIPELPNCEHTETTLERITLDGKDPNAGRNGKGL